jgi:OmcA/MtrC family decaheme c-type cytochrome
LLGYQQTSEHFPTVVGEIKYTTFRNLLKQLGIFRWHACCIINEVCLKDKVFFPVVVGYRVEFAHNRKNIGSEKIQRIILKLSNGGDRMKMQSLKTLLYVVLCCMLAAGIGILSGCSGGSDGSQGPAGPAGANGTSGNNNSDVTLPLNSVPSATENLQAQITSAVVSTTTGSLVVTFKLLDEKGAPLDPRNLITAGGSCRFFVAQIDETGNYKNYITSGGLPTNDPASRPAAADAAASTAFAATTTSGVYTFTFSKIITTSTNPAYDPASTHTVVAQISRNIVSSKGVTLQQAVNPYINFRPDGNTVTVKREIAPVSACNECHGTLALHGGTRRDVSLCIVCHNPGVIDPKTGNTVDFKVMIHKIHMGKNLPSNKVGSHYTVQSSDFSTVVYPLRSGDSFTNNTPMDCAKCHKAGKDAKGNTYGANVDKWKTSANITNCPSCHDRTTFDLATTVTLTSGITSTTIAAVVHGGGAQDDTQCALCHDATVPASSYSGSYSVPAVHQLPETSTLNSNLTFSITQVEGAISGSTPTVHFTVKDGAGADYSLVGGGGSGTVADSATLVLSYMTGADYDNSAAQWVSGTTYVQAKTKTVSSTSVNPNGLKVGSEYVVSFGTVTVPAGAGVGTIAVYGKQGVTIPTNPATAHRSASQHITSILGSSIFSLYNFDRATGNPAAAASIRREVVSTAKCSSCHHFKLSFHSRLDTKICVMCHAPSLIYNTTEGYSGNLKDMIHGIHGAQASTTVFKSTEVAEFPNDSRNCTVCHISDPMAGLPLPSGTVGSLKSGTSTTALDGTRVLPTKAACMSCHEGAQPAAHADLNTSAGVESCSVCHATGTVLGNVHAPVR